jgi:tryptophan halogenase
VLYGMGFRTEVGALDTADSEPAATRLFQEAQASTHKMRAQLPKNRELLRKIYEYGLQPI